MKRIIESVPNFSEGRNPETIRAITQALASVPGVAVLHTDSGATAGRTVITLAGDPEAVTEAAFRGIREAARRIDMRNHRGEHPRLGATDVLPLVPVAGISLQECALLARQLAQRVGDELGIPVYCYEAAASAPYRRALEACRRGGYEGLARKMVDLDWKPDYGPQFWDEEVARTGASVIGARDFLGAVNFNLAPTGDPGRDTAAAKAIAREIRTSGHTDHSLPALKAIGWYIDEYGFAQVSANLTDMHATGLAEAFRAVKAAARRHGMSVTGTEVIGLLPLRALTAAGRQLSWEPDLGDEQALAAAVHLLGLDTMQEQGRPFDPREKVVEYLLAAKIP